MKSFLVAAMIAITATIFGACSKPAAPANNSNAAANKAQVPSLRDDLVALETKTHQALKNKDAAYMNEMVPDNFLGYVGQKLATKKEVLDWFSNATCTIKSQTLSDEQVHVISPDSALLTFITTTDGMCGDKPWPAKTWAATLYVKKEGKWRPHYHQEAVIPEPDAAPKAATAMNKAELMPPSMTDDFTKTLTKRETDIWNSVKNGDKKFMDENTAPTFMQLGMNGRGTREELIKMVEDKSCKIDSYSFSNTVSSRLTENLAILAFAAKEKGECDGKPIPEYVHAADILLMQPDGKWKSAFYMESPVK